MALSRNQIFDIINMVKLDLGMGDYEFSLVSDKNKDIYNNSCDDGVYAEFDGDIYEKTVKIKLDKSLKEKDDEFIRKVILHEMIHGRLSVAQKKLSARTEQIEYEEEEDLVNDLVRLLTKGNFKWE